MTTSRSTSPTQRRRHRRAALLTALAGSLIAGSLGTGLATPAGADEPSIDHVMRICDETGCLIAWQAVDSDGDGVGDADETVAGTDPYDAASTPPMAHLAELLIERGLPSFESGLSTMVVFPADLVDLAKKASGDRLAGLAFEGFDLAGRADTMTRLGISAEQMADVGVDTAGRLGFTIGLGPPTKDNSGMPAVRVGGVDLRTISADGATDPKKEPKKEEPKKEEPKKEEPKQEPKKDEPKKDDGKLPTNFQHGGSVKKENMGEGTTVYHFKDGTVRTTFKDGWIDQKGGKVTGEGTWKKFVNPDADSSAVTADPDRIEAWERTLGEAKRTIEDGAAPRADDAPDPEVRRTLVAYIEADLAVGTSVSVEPDLVSDAQPERRPGMPDPMQAAPKGGVHGNGPGGGCPVEGNCGG